MIGWLSRLCSRRWPTEDAAWKPTGVTYTTATHYDEAQAVKASQRARQRSETGRYYRVSKGTVVPMRQKQTGTE